MFGSDGNSGRRNGHEMPMLIAGLMTRGAESPSEQTEPPKPTSTDDAVGQWPAFADAVRRRLILGKRSYASEPASEKPLGMLCDEVSNEIFDLCGWSFLLYRRVEAMRAKLEAAEKGDDE